MFQLEEVFPQADDQVARSISTLLTTVSANLAESRGGHVPDEVVETIIHEKYTSVDAVRSTFKDTAHRFVVRDREHGLVGTILVSKEPNVVLAYNSSCLNADANALDMKAARGCHSVFNLAVRPDQRRRGVARFIFEQLFSAPRRHFSGKGIWVRSEPHEHDVYMRLGFNHISECDQFFPDGVYLPAGIGSPVEFNQKYACTCPRDATSREMWKTKKFKYAVFVRHFDVA